MTTEAALKEMDCTYNEELNLWVSTNGRVFRGDTTWEHKGLKVRRGREVSFHDNGHGYMVCNLGMGGKYWSITQHRVVYCTLKGLEYKGDYTVGHLNDNPGDNHPDNLYGIFGTGQAKANIEHKQNAYKLLEMLNRGELFDKNGELIDLK